jgi:hypothetical protein
VAGRALVGRLGSVPNYIDRLVRRSISWSIHYFELDRLVGSLPSHVDYFIV